MYDRNLHPDDRFAPIAPPLTVRFGHIVSTAHTIYNTRWGLVVGAFCVATLIQWIIGIPAGLLDIALFGQNTVFSPIASLTNILVGTPLTLGPAYVAVRIYRGQHTSVGDVFVGFSRWVPVVCVGLAIQAAVIAMSAAMGVTVTAAATSASPGVILTGAIFALVCVALLIWVSIRLYFATLICVDPEGPRPSPIECLSTSWNMTSGHTLPLLGVALLMTVIATLTAVCLIIPLLLYGGPIFAAAAAAAYAFACHESGIIPLAPYDDNCPHCGYDLSATDTPRCPECGRDVPRVDTQPEPQPPASNATHNTDPSPDHDPDRDLPIS